MTHVERVSGLRRGISLPAEQWRLNPASSAKLTNGEFHFFRTSPEGRERRPA